MSDADLRRLKRLARLGDVEAQAQLAHALERTDPGPAPWAADPKRDPIIRVVARSGWRHRKNQRTSDGRSIGPSVDLSRRRFGWWRRFWVNPGPNGTTIWPAEWEYQDRASRVLDRQVRRLREVRRQPRTTS